MRLASFILAPLLAGVVSSSASAQELPPPDLGGPIMRGGAPRPGRPVRDARPERPGTAVIRGRVVSAEGGAPIRRAQVRAIASESREPRLTTTDPQGRYELKDLPAGRYNISVAKAGYISTQYGQQRALESGKPVELADGQTMEKIDFSLSRAGVITGRVVDEFGDPVAEVMVSAMRYAFRDGERRLVNAGRPIPSNDIGQFRIYGLPAGDYYISASARGGGGFMAGPFGGPMAENADRSGYAPTYYPGTPNIAEAQRLTLRLGQELTAGELTLQPIRTVRIAGVVLSSQGVPMAGGFVSLRPDSELAGSGMLMFQGGAVGPDGSFTIANVAPGNYIIEARQNRRRNNDAEAEFASQPLAIGTDDVAGLTLVASRGATVLGNVVFDGQPQTSVNWESMRVFVRPVQRVAGPMDMQRPAAVRQDSTFEVSGLGGRGTLGVIGTPSGWSLKAVFLGSSDVTDTAIDFRPGDTIRDVQIVLTDRVTELSGTVADSRGRPLKDFNVLAFAENSARWQSATSRFVRTARPDQDGRFKFSGLPSEDYLVVAVESIPEGEWNNPDFLEIIRNRAVRVTLGEGEKKSLDLKLSDAP
jgi:hypothetical protein